MQVQGSSNQSNSTNTAGDVPVVQKSGKTHSSSQKRKEDLKLNGGNPELDLTIKVAEEVSAKQTPILLQTEDRSTGDASNSKKAVASTGDILLENVPLTSALIPNANGVLPQSKELE